ncbi:histidine phosphatase family protein [uncultured Paenalcaligenes sp.]|uniref:histidine phosphatase family protein n=1 Tax=uncultured Paenalcaligenes sp. TaxID=1588925 RepID=UPI002613F97C|nr:histidine phosphatase family protein [uncultured Paenalcaligenes sp.]
MYTTQIWLIRHGETDWNAAQRLQGWRDIPLNDTGKNQAKSVQRFLDQQRIAFDGVLSSDLQRAIQTAQIAFAQHQYPIEQIPALRERNYGIYEGHPWQSLTQLPNEPAPKINLRDPSLDVPEGESLLTFHQRIIEAFNQIALQRPNQKLAVIAHGGVIEMVWRYIQQADLSTPRPYKILNASVNHFAINKEQQWQEIAWAQVAHLDHLKD